MEAFSEALAAHQAAGLQDAARETGVYVGVSQLEYARISYESKSALNTYYATGAHLSVASGGPLVLFVCVWGVGGVGGVLGGGGC